MNVWVLEYVTWGGRWVEGVYATADAGKAAVPMGVWKDVAGAGRWTCSDPKHPVDDYDLTEYPVEGADDVAGG